MARTMTDKQERDLRDKASRLHDWPTFGLATQRIFMDLLAELDAERAAHKETTAEANFAHFEVAALKARLALAEATIAELVQYTEHHGRCVRSTFSAGRPTPNGGYECLYGSTWYEVKPVDRTPACDCGLDAALAAWRAAK